MTPKQTIESIWNEISEPVLNNVKVYLLSRYVSDILRHFSQRVDYVAKRYAYHLPPYVASSEIDDLKTIARLELLESLKVWDPAKNQDVWPLAQARILGAMKDHIRYITKSDPSRFYEWVTDAAQVFLAVNDRADFEHHIETGVQLGEAMKVITYRERKIVLYHSKEDLTFKEIGKKLGVSESQISRIYKAAIEKIKKQIAKTSD